ncbi:small ribosomal subunit protein uS9m-like [Dysidea avara]|uniref:small ribosomal subunit protein uS9m-like n=1 Tax=Dysidea avara TaxID=196820 RepID=UPI003323D891
MARFLKSYQYGIAALQSVRVLETISARTTPPGSKLLLSRCSTNVLSFEQRALQEKGRKTKHLSKEEAKFEKLRALEEMVTDPDIKKEIEAYYEGRRRLAIMMGCDPETFTEQDVNNAIRYLLPSGLYAKDARPFLKHPLEYYPKKNTQSVDADGRPFEAGFFTGFPAYHNLVYEVLEHTRQLDELYTARKSTDKGSDKSGTTSSNPNLSRWLQHNQMQDLLKEKITEQQYKSIIERLDRLAAHPLAGTIQTFLDRYRRVVVVLQSRKKMEQLDDSGLVHTTGYRKSAVANVTVSRGDGKFDINGLSLLEAFPLIQSREQILYPFVVVDGLGLFDVKATVEGGGKSGQAGALRHGISLALTAFGENYYEVFEKANLLIRDSRRRERKKPGQRRARKKFTWVKR